MIHSIFRSSAAPIGGAALVLLAAVIPARSEAPIVTAIKINPPAMPQARRAEPMVVSKPACNVAGQFTRFDLPLKRTAGRLLDGQPLKIVAVGSSSTAGAGASTKAASYPSRLAIELKRRFPMHGISVINRGVGGEQVADMVARFDKTVIAEHPDLVLWQVGTNALLRDHPLRPAGSLIREGVAKLKASGADVVLIDPQFAPKVIKKRGFEEMVALIAAAAREANVDLFHRFALMRRWREVEGMPFRAFLSKDELHMNDWSYRCIAKYLAGAIAEAVNRPTGTASFASPF